MKQKDQSINNKMQALKDANSTCNQNQREDDKRPHPNVWSGNNKGNNGWKPNKGYSKGSVNLQPNHKYHKGGGKGKGKGKSKYKH